VEQLRDLGLYGEVLNPIPEIELLIELETELDLGLTITRDDISERQFQALIMIRKFRSERAESQAKAQQAQAFHQAAAARARNAV
jgi:hypothetical protein